MVWTRKAEAPAYSNILNWAAAFVTGEPDQWIVPWFSYLPGTGVVNIDALCARGPREQISFGPEDFTGAVGWNPATTAIGAAALVGKITAWLEQGMFGMYCEEVTGNQAFSCIDLGNMNFNGPPEDPSSNNGVIHVPVPAFTQEIQLVCVQVGNLGGSSATAIATGLQRNHDGNMSFWGDLVGEFCVCGNVPANYLFAGGAAGTVAIYSRRNIIAHVKVCGMYGEVNTFTPDPIEQPPNAIAPAPKTYETIADLGKELDAIENKLHWVLQYTTAETIKDFAPMEAAEVFEEVLADDELELDAEVAAFIVTTTNLGPFTNITFGNPPKLARVGRVYLGNGTAWDAPLDITTSPMLITRPSPLHSRIRVQVDLPAVATVTTLKRLPPMG